VEIYCGKLKDIVLETRKENNNFNEFIQKLNFKKVNVLKVSLE